MNHKLHQIFASLMLATLFATSAWGQSRVQWGRSDVPGYQGTTPGFASQPPLDPYAMPTRGGLFGSGPLQQQPTPPVGFGDPAFAPGPSAQYPNGFGPVIGSEWGMPDGLIFQEPLRRVQGPRLRHAWLVGNDGRELGVNETDISVAVAFPNFLGTTQPLYVLPSFSLQMWDGPKGAPHPPMADLPGETYSAFVDMGWESDRAQMIGMELGLRVGVFSDFDTMNSDSLRIQGKGLVRYRITPALSLRVGVLYVDRLRVKILPAGGLLWEPNSQTRFDFYFPNPKASHYWMTLGNSDVWCYFAGEYGGGSWTIERAADGLNDRFDYNDIRLALGVEWGASELIRQGRRFGFAEIAWVLDREVIYNRRAADGFRATDTVMIRAGFGY